MSNEPGTSARVAAQASPRISWPAARGFTGITR